MERIHIAFHDVRQGHRPLPQLPPEEIMKALLDTAHQVKPMPKKPRLDLARLRNIALFEALRSSGMRVGELGGLKRDDLDYRNHAARVTGKGDKQRIVYFDDPAWNAIQEYLKERNDGARGRALYQLHLFARHDRRASERVCRSRPIVFVSSSINSHAKRTKSRRRKCAMHIVLRLSTRKTDSMIKSWD